MNKCVLDIKHISKEYRLYNSELDRLKEAFHPFKKSYHKKFYALSDVNFQIMEGEKVGIIGANGAGKSTLLKIVTGVLKPTEGEIISRGKIAALLELGAGFNQNYTGIENIRLNGTLMGYSDEEIENKIGKITEFADIGDFINQPVRTYSSGMFVRLAFATQIFSEPDILIVDEALSVGDIRFQQKCFRAMESIMQDKTVVLVTHDTAAVTRFCQRVVWINHGQVMYDGNVPEGLKRYKEFLINQAIEEKEQIGGNDFSVASDNTDSLQKSSLDIYIPDVIESVHYKGNGQAKIYQCGLYNEENEIVENVEPKQKVKCIANISFIEEVFHPIFGITIMDRLGNEVIGINSQTLGMELPVAKDKQQYILSFIMPELNHGEYTITIAIANGYQNDHIQLCWIDDALVFRILERQYDIPGIIYMDKGTIETYSLD